MTNAYENPPLVEAVCEFRFAPGADWDTTIPGLLYERLSDVYPNKTSGKHVNVTFGIEGTGLRPTIGAQDRTVFSSEDERDLVQVLPRVISVHRKAPYTSWDAFKPRVESALNAYLSVASPSEVYRASVRYRNQFEFTHRIEVSDYLDFYPSIGDGFEGERGAFLCGVEFPRGEEERLQVELTTVEPQDPQSTDAMRLDLNYMLLESRDIGEFSASDWLDDAHAEVEAAFEGAITEQLRARFRGEEV